MKITSLLGLVALAAVAPAGAELPDGYWPVERSQPILDATLEVTLDPDLSHLHERERAAIEELLAAGEIMQRLYEQQLHRDSGRARQALTELHAGGADPAAVRNLLDLFYLSKGPVATTLDNERLPFVPAGGEQDGKNVYPFGLARQQLDAFLDAVPAAADAILAPRTVVRRATAENIAADIAKLDEFPELDALHDGLRAQLESPGLAGFYAVPYALEYASELRRARGHLTAAADLLAAEAPDFAAYLRHRGRDFLSGDYEAGDAAWVSGDLGSLNLQIGSYETYNDNLMGVKAFYSASVLVRDADRSAALESAMAELQSLEDALPYEHHKTVRRRIPVGVYNVIADFGQARGANTASILPNEADHARKYGRTILMRYNIMTDDALFSNRKLRYDAAVAAAFRDDLTKEGGFNRTLWHEVGHYLGVSRTADGRDLNAALGDKADLLEELKADLVSLYSARRLREIGYYDDAGVRALYADGVRRTLQDVQPRPDQPYQNMQLMQFNYYLAAGLFQADPVSGLLAVDYDKFHEVVTDMLTRVLEIQHAGDYDDAAAFFSRWNGWDDDLHGGLAKRIRDSGAFRRTLVRYSVLEN